MPPVSLQYIRYVRSFITRYNFCPLLHLPRTSPFFNTVLPKRQRDESLPQTASPITISTQLFPVESRSRPFLGTLSPAGPCPGTAEPAASRQSPGGLEALPCPVAPLPPLEGDGRPASASPASKRLFPRPKQAAGAG